MTVPSFRQRQPLHSQEPSFGLNFSKRFPSDLFEADTTGADTGEALVAALVPGDVIGFATAEKAGEGTWERREVVVIGTAGPSVPLNGEASGGVTFGRVIW